MTAQPEIRFNNGAAYEAFMGVWSRSVGDAFLDWLAPPRGLAWADVGCGNGAFTELLVDRVAPAKVLGVDPSPAQIDYARQRHKAGVAEFLQGDAMALPAADHSFDAAVMALVIFFVPEPPRGVAEMLRVTKPGGLISAYAWDMLGGGFPLELIYDELATLGVTAPMPPSAEVSRMDALAALWHDAGVADTETQVITVERTFPDFETLWAINLSGQRLSGPAASMAPDLIASLKAQVKARLVPDASGRITTSARAHAIKGRAPR